MQSPIAFFAFNRPLHTLKTLKSLSENESAEDTEIFAFIDGPRNNTEIHLIDNVEKIINSFSNNFKKIIIRRSDKNLSAGTNIRNGISSVLSSYDRVIVLEDDICVSKYFLDFMNKALDKYKQNNKVWHINGFNIPNNSVLINDSCFTRSMVFWGWATWKDRWFKFKDDPLATDPFYLISKFNKKNIRDFNLGIKHDIRWSMVIANANGNLPNTLDIFWYAFIFMNNGLCLGPRISLTRNIGHDGSGDNCSLDEKILKDKINKYPITLFPDQISENLDALQDIQKYYNKKYSFTNRVINKIKLVISIIIKFLKKFR